MKTSALDGLSGDGAASSADAGVERRGTAAWSAAGSSYSRVLSNSMKKIMATRPRVMMVGTGTGALVSGVDPAAENNRENDLELVARFASAAEAKDKEQLVTLVTQHPQIVYIQNVDDQVPLHLACALVPNYFYVDLIEMMVRGNPESPANMDQAGQTPLHILCLNPSVTCQALSALLATLPASAAMCDKRSNLGLHYLCGNANCDLDMLRQLGQSDTYQMRNEDGRTPLHCLAMAHPVMKKSCLLHLLQCHPDSAAIVDTDGRAVLHWACEADGMDVDILEALLPVSTNAVTSADNHSDLPLHLLCQNPVIDVALLKGMLHANPAAIDALTENHLTVLHFICANESVTEELLSELLVADKRSELASRTDMFGATALHLLCMNEAITAGSLRVLLLYCADDSFKQDVHGRSPLHYLCMNRAISPELVWLFLERAQDLVREIDVDGKAPLHHVCSNKSVTSVTLEILFDACPSAAMVTDNELRLRIQYLVDNPSVPGETTALLISGPTSYRLRYDFLSIVGGHAVSFLQNQELVYLQSNLAMDSKSSSRVLIKFYSTAAALDHDRAVIARLNVVAQRQRQVDPVHWNDYSLVMYDAFEDAKRRATVRTAAAIAPEDHIGDASVTLDYGLVIEAPSYTLESLYAEKVADSGDVRAIVADIGACLAFWHREALMVHGNIVLECVGHYPRRGLRLLNFHTSHEFHDHVSIGVNAVKIESCAPEAARAFLANESFVPTAASDLWQFGCLVYHLATGESLVTTLVPWSRGLGQLQILHVISALTDEVIQHAIGSVDSCLRGLLVATLLTNPAQRWTIDRLMDIDAFRNESGSASAPTSAFDTLSARLQRHSDCELLSVEHQRSAKYAQDQLDFIKKEQRQLRGQLLASKIQLRESQENSDQLRAENAQLRAQLDKLLKQKRESQQELRVFARNHQSMTHQLHTTMQMVLDLVPLAKKVYGANADEFLSSILSQAARSESLSTIDIGSARPSFGRTNRAATSGTGIGGGGPTRRKSAVQLVKNQLQNSVLAHGCLHTWAHSSPPPIREPHELSFSSTSEGDPDETNQRDDDEDKRHLGEGHPALDRDVTRRCDAAASDDDTLDNQAEHERSEEPGMFLQFEGSLMTVSLE